MRNRMSMVIMLALFMALGVFAPASAQVLPIPQVGQKGDVYVSPSVLRQMQGMEKYAAPTVSVIVSFNTRGGRSGALSLEDVSAARATVLSALPAGSYELVSSFNRIAAVSLKINDASLAALMANPAVYAINKDRVVKRHMAEANAVTGVGPLHTAGLTGSGAVVAIVDSGVDITAGGVIHPALEDDLIDHQCFRTENDCPAAPNEGRDQDGHGTHVAGMITGPEGVAPDAQFYALKVFTTGDTSDTNILNALDFVIDTNTTTPGAIDLVNMSLGGDNYADQASCDADSAGYVTAFSTLNGLGVTIFVSTGNDGEIDAIGSPGCVTGAVGVGSTGDAEFSVAFSTCTDNAEPDKVSCYSNATQVQGTGELLDLMAPGCYIVSTGLAGATDAENCGTSMATPYAAGVAALLVEYLADNSMSMTPAQIEEHMEVTGVQVSDYRMPIGAPTFPRVSPPNMIGALAIDEPTGFQITAATPTSISTSWNSVAGSTEYRVYASADGAAPYLAGTVTAPTTTFVDNAPVCGTLTYFVRSFDGTYESMNSNTDTDTSRPCPLAPSALTLTVVDADSHTLTWTDNSADETAFILQRNFNEAGFVDYQTLGANVTTYTDDSLACGVYTYRVVAERAGDLSTPSNEVERGICAPANDNFANAEVVAPDVAYTDTEPNVSYGTEEAGDPIYSCHFGSAGPGFQGVWYSITPTVNTRVTASTAATTIFAPAAGAPDTLIAIYTGTMGDFFEIACNDDINGGNFRSSVSSNLDAGITYYVFVSQWVDTPVGTSGNLVTAFSWSAPIIVPANDLVANAAVISTTPYTLSVASAQNATVSGTDLPHVCAWNSAGTAIVPRIGTSTMWWTFTPTFDGEIDLDTLSSSGSFTDTILTVYTGTSGSFTSVACNDDEESAGVSLRSEILDFPVTGGTTYTIYVSRWSTVSTVTTGTAVLDLDFTVSPDTLVTPTTVAVEEGGTTDTYDVVLSTVPSADVVITVTGDAQCSVSPTELTFNSTAAQTVTVTAVDDADIEGAHTCTITHSADSTDVAYDEIAIDDVTGNITDNDGAPVETELLENGGFETAGATNKLAANWNLLNASGDKRECKPGKAHTDSCNFKFTGSATDSSTLGQSVDLTGLTFAVGDTLDLSGYFRGLVGSGVKIKLTVTYSDAAMGLVKLKVRSTSGYELREAATYTLTSANVTQIKVKFSNIGTSSIIRVDDMSLIYTPATSGRGAVTRDSGDVLPPPAAPDGFRGNN